MKKIWFVAFLFAAGLPAQAYERVPNQAKSLAAERPYAERMKEGIDERVQRADAWYAARLAEKAEGPQTALFSFSKRLDKDDLARLLDDCRCEVLQVQRTVGETQLSFGAHDLSTDKQYFADLATQFEKYLMNSLTEMDADLKQADDTSRRWTLQRYSAYSKALTALRTDGMTFNGLMVRGTLPAIDALRAKAQPRVLAVELVPGTKLPFAIPLEIYE